LQPVSGRQGPAESLVVVEREAASKLSAVTPGASLYDEAMNSSGQRFTGMPRPARYSFICRIVYVPKWAMEATSTASACPSTTAS